MLEELHATKILQTTLETERQKIRAQLQRKSKLLKTLTRMAQQVAAHSKANDESEGEHLAKQLMMMQHNQIQAKRAEQEAKMYSHIRLQFIFAVLF
jgi:hypothetical protein